LFSGLWHKTIFVRSRADGGSGARSVVRRGVSRAWGNRRGFVLAIALVCFGVAKPVAAADAVPAAVELPPRLSLAEALRILDARGLDLLISDANARGAEGAVVSAGAVPNPVAQVSVGNAFTYSNNGFSKSDCHANGAACSPWIYSVGVGDSAALEDTLSGKRNLRLKVARNALAATKLARVDARRTLMLAVKTAYLEVAQATLASKFARDIAATEETALKRAHDRYAGGAINEGDLERIEAEKLEADQAADAADYGLRSARVALAFLLGVRGAVRDFEVDTGVLDYAVPEALRDASEVGLLRSAVEHRPDLAGAGYQRQEALAQLELVRRQRFPDLALG